MLQPFLSALRASHIKADWALCAFGPGETDCLVAGYKAGGKIRVGFENSLWNRDGSVAANNAERVAEIVSVCGSV